MPYIVLYIAIYNTFNLCGYSLFKGNWDWDRLLWNGKYLLFHTIMKSVVKSCENVNQLFKGCNSLVSDMSTTRTVEGRINHNGWPINEFENNKISNYNSSSFYYPVVSCHYTQLVLIITNAVTIQIQYLDRYLLTIVTYHKKHILVILSLLSFTLEMSSPICSPVSMVTYHINLISYSIPCHYSYLPCKYHLILLLMSL